MCILNTNVNGNKTIESFAIELIETLGLLGVCFVLFLAVTIVFVPSELLVAFAGYSAANGKLPIVGVIFAATIGVYLGILTVYALARYAGNRKVRKLIMKYGHFVRLKTKHVARAELLFKKYSSKVAFIGQLIPAARFGTALFAGMQKIPFWNFAAYTLGGSIVWVTAFALLGYYFSEGYKAVIDYYDFVLQVVGGVLVLAILIFVIKRRRQ